MPKKAFITGITGQDGSYLAELLLSKGYEVHGIDRRVAYEDAEARYSRINHLIKNNAITLHYGNVADFPTVWHLIHKLQPDELYHLAAQSQVAVSFKDEFSTFDNNFRSTQHILTILREVSPKTKFYFAATSEMFGQTKQPPPQNENTPFNPVSPYAISKLAGFHLTKMYRDAYKIFAVSGILFNHESPRRGLEFVTRKITSGIAKIRQGREEKISVGNLEAGRDWGYAGDYVEAMWRMLQHPEPDDYVVATGETHTVREFLERAFKLAGVDLIWEGEGVSEKGTDKATGKVVVEIDPQFFRPAEVHSLRGDYSKAKQKLGWEPTVKFDELIERMIAADLKAQLA